MYLSIGTKITDFLKVVKDFIIENSRNPFFWISIILIFLLVFEYVYNKLNKD